MKDYVLNWARTKDPGIIGVSRVSSPRRAYVLEIGVDGKTLKKHVFSSSVTQIVNGKWESSDSTYVNEAMRIGTEVHDAIDRHVCGCPVEHPLSCDEANHAFAAYLDWEKHQTSQIVCQEGIVWNEAWDYAGTFDSLRKEQDGTFTIIDNKTGPTFRPTYGVQLAAYELALSSIGHPRCNQAICLQLHKDGMGWTEVQVWSNGDQRDAWGSAFLAQAQAKKWLEYARRQIVFRASTRSEDELWETWKYFDANDLEEIPF